MLLRSIATHYSYYLFSTKVPGAVVSAVMPLNLGDSGGQRLAAPLKGKTRSIAWMLLVPKTFSWLRRRQWRCYRESGYIAITNS